MKIPYLLHSLAVMVAMACVLSSCSSNAAMAADPFDRAIDAAMGMMAGGILGPNEGGGL